MASGRMLFRMRDLLFPAWDTTMGDGCWPQATREGLLEEKEERTLWHWECTLPYLDPKAG